MALNTGKKIIRRIWDVISMPDTVITHVYALGSDQLEQLIFTDIHGCLIGDFEIPGMDPSDANHIKIPGVDVLEIDIYNIEIPVVYVYRQDPQVIDIIYPKIPPTDRAPIEPAIVH